MQKHSVLVADDDDMLRETVAELLRLAGYSVESAANGVEALTSLKESRPAVVLLDMHMPVLDGWGVVRELDSLGLDVPVVIMSGDHGISYAAALELQAEEWLEKPFKMKELLPAIERACA